MITYADTTVCPSCRTPLPPASADGTPRCETCHVPLQHPIAGALFRALSHADVLVAELRTLPAPQPVVNPTPTTPQAPIAAPGRPTSPPFAAVPHITPPPLETGVRSSSVPAILLSLGALCLLVAGVTFLAVAWSWLGIGGRTAVLVGLTAATGIGGLALGRRSLRVAAESLVTVSLGLLTLDVVGAYHAGWLGTPTSETLTLWIGLALVVATVAFTAADRRLLAPQIGAALGMLLSLEAMVALTEASITALVLATLVLVCSAKAGQVARRLPAAGTIAAVASIAWLQALVVALVHTFDSTLSFSALWLDGPGPALVVLAFLLLAPVAFTRAPLVAQLCVAATATMLTAVLAVPVLDEGASAVALASLGAATVWTAIAVALRSEMRLVAIAPGGASLVPALGVSLALAGQAIERVSEVGSDLTLSGAQTAAAPWLLALTATVLVAGVSTFVRMPAWPRAAAGLLALAGIATLALYPVSLWFVVGALCILAIVAAADALRIESPAAAVQTVAAGSVGFAALVLSTPASGLVLLSTLTLTALAASTMLLARFDGGSELGGVVLPLAAAGLLWSGADVVGVDVAFRALPVLLALGALALVRPRLEVELPSAFAALVAAAVAVDAAGDVGTSLALHLTLAGALVTASSLLHPTRRAFGWVGSVLLVLATWVRLADIGVTAPEAYTLPAAIGLLAVGLRGLLRDRSVATSTVLLPGLLLATVPSLLRVMSTDPVSLRALALGAGCLALVLVGTQLRWSAPLLVGAAVGGLLTLVELAPYAAQTPQWVVIGLAGTVLTVVGVTWEHRVVELRRAAGYVGRLR